VADALLDERRELASGLQPAMGIFTIPDVTNRPCVYAPIDESGHVAKTERYHSRPFMDSVSLVLMLPAVLVLFATVPVRVMVVPVRGPVVPVFPVLPLVAHRAVFLRWAEQHRW
jgi:hypothetical protein